MTDVQLTPEGPDWLSAGVGQKQLTPDTLAQAIDLLEANNASQAVQLLSSLEGVDAAAPDLRTRYYVNLAWGNYRGGNNDTAEGRAGYGAALAAAEKAGDDPAAKACIASVLAQSKEHRNDARLFALAAEVNLVEHPKILNSIIIRASKGEVPQALIEDIHGLVRQAFTTGEAAPVGQDFGHLLQNYGKLLLQVLQRPAEALKCFEQALSFYDQESKGALPHIGGAYFWAGQCKLKLGDKAGWYAMELAALAFKERAAGDAYATDAKAEQSRKALREGKGDLPRLGVNFPSQQD